MKKILFSALFAASSITAANAATTITAFNAALGTSGFANQVLLNGTGMTTGSILIGTFNTLLDLSSPSTDVSDLGALGWSQFGSQSFSTNVSYPGIFGAVGATGATGTLPESNTGPLVGNPIYAIISDGAGELIIWDSGKLFAAEVPGVGGATVTFGTVIDPTTLVRGAAAVNTGLAGALVSRNGQLGVTFIPEPSAALLGAIGAIGLLRRRRI